LRCHAYRGRTLIAATGSFSDSYLPDVAGRSDFAGTVLHSGEYRNPGPFAGQRLVVVGGGNSGV
jgi:putative flavoprotein involved in K+ transport